MAEIRRAACYEPCSSLDTVPISLQSMSCRKAQIFSCHSTPDGNRNHNIQLLFLKHCLSQSREKAWDNKFLLTLLLQ